MKLQRVLALLLNYNSNHYGGGGFKDDEAGITQKYACIRKSTYTGMGF